MSLEINPTGVQNIEDGALDIIACRNVAGEEIQQGDIIVQVGFSGGTEGETTGACAVQYLDHDSISNLQTAISGAFLGIAHGYIAALNTLASNRLPVATRGRVRLECSDVTALYIGQLVACHCDSDGGGTYVPVVRTVEATATDSKSIGRLVADKAAADTTVLVEFRGAVTTGPMA